MERQRCRISKVSEQRLPERKSERKCAEPLLESLEEHDHNSQYGAFWKSSARQDCPARTPEMILNAGVVTFEHHLENKVTRVWKTTLGHGEKLETGETLRETSVLPSSSDV